MQNADSGVQLGIVCPGKGSIVFGPLTRSSIGNMSEYDFLDGRITVVDADGVTETLADRNGIESLALANFRDDLRQLVHAGQGIVFFGDHDFGQIVELEIIQPGVIRVLANLASLDRFGLPVGELAVEAVDELVDQIDRIESSLGPLLGYCGGCGAPARAYYPKPLTP